MNTIAEKIQLGDGTDWTLTELGLLGDISIAMSVTIFDNGAHQNPIVHKNPFEGHLVYTPEHRYYFRGYSK